MRASAELAAHRAPHGLAIRLDAELQRHEVTTIDVARLLRTVVSVANEVRREDGVIVSLAIEGDDARAFRAPGNDSRLSQVIDNLVDKSFVETY